MIMQILILVLLALAGIASLVGGIWFLIAAFRVHILWGLALLVFPVLSFVFLLLHWEDVKKPFFLNLCSISLLLLVFFLSWNLGGDAAATETPAELPAFSLTEKITEIKQNAERRKAREAIAARGFLGRTLEDVEQELGPPHGKITRDNLVEYQYIDRGLTLISSNGVTVTDEIRR